MMVQNNGTIIMKTAVKKSANMICFNGKKWKVDGIQ